MFGRAYQLMPAVVTGILMVLTARAEPGYLPWAGPLPLRFRVATPPVSEHAKPAIVAPSPPAIALPAPTMPSAPMETNKVNSKPAAITNAPPVEFTARETDLTPPATNVADKVISPEMLIQYFTMPTNGATNAASVGTRAPVRFTPPPVTPPVKASPLNVP